MVAYTLLLDTVSGRAQRDLAIAYLVAQSSALPARPMLRVSSYYVHMGRVPYVKQRLDSGGVLGRL